MALQTTKGGDGQHAARGWRIQRHDAISTASLVAVILIVLTVLVLA